MSPAPLVGLFIGGASRRMHGQPKGLLPAPRGSGTLLDRLVMLVRSATPSAEVVLVGRNSAYASLPLRQLPDTVEGAGPLAGYAALAREALRLGRERMITLACDIPYLERPLLERLIDHAPESAAVAARVDGLWQPFFGRYDAARCRPVIDRQLASARRSLLPVLDELGTLELPLDEREALQLRDWDTPEDVERG